MFIKKNLLYSKLLAGISIYFLVSIVQTSSAVVTDWTMDFEQQKIVMIPVGGIITPIETKKSTMVLNHKDRGRFVITNGTMRSTTRTPVVAAVSDVATVYNNRPTLFVSIHGYNDSQTTDTWQYTLIEKITHELDDSLNPRYSQNMGFTVNWDSKEPMRRQVKDVAGLVNQFLNKRAYPWDVVLIGFSRGGIFTSELSKLIVANSNIKNLHSILLDPTAVGFFGDFYPRTINSATGTQHYGSLYYDGIFVDPIFYNIPSLTIESDQPIPGYNNYGLGNADYLFNSTTHEEFADEWLVDTNKGLERALTNIFATKDTGLFGKDNIGQWEIVRVQEENLFIDGNVDIVDGNLYVDGMVVVGLNQASFSGTFGVDSIDFAASVFSTSAMASIKADEATIAANTELGNMVANITTDSASVHTSFLGVDSSINVDPTNVSVSDTILGTNVSVSAGIDGGAGIKIGNSRISIPGIGSLF